MVNKHGRTTLITIQKTRPKMAKIGFGQPFRKIPIKKNRKTVLKNQSEIAACEQKPAIEKTIVKSLWADLFKKQLVDSGISDQKLEIQF